MSYIHEIMTIHENYALDWINAAYIADVHDYTDEAINGKFTTGDFPNAICHRKLMNVLTFLVSNSTPGSYL